MDFGFNVNKLLTKKISKVTHILIPEDFRGDKRELSEAQRNVSMVLDKMGEASAVAQGLNKPVTSASKLRDTDHIVYLFVDSYGNSGMGSVVGLLKTGSKNLFMFDEAGMHFQLQPRCVLDFYIHETKQRTGLGKILYEHMLENERVTPVELAIDRPSNKFLQFLQKHYGLDGIITQNNNFVVFRGFFDHVNQTPKCPSQSRGYSSSSPLYEKRSSTSFSDNKSPQSTGTTRNSYGRYAAARPVCSIANIIHNAPVFGQTEERTG